MNTNDLNTALMKRWLLLQTKFRMAEKPASSEEILHHTHEYTVREIL